MFPPITDEERFAFFNPHRGCHIPGYTGHCPTLRFQYGTSYGIRTKEILQELREKNMISNGQILHNYKSKFNELPLRLDSSSSDITTDPENLARNIAPKYIIGYTGFIPTLNFRSGKSYSRSAEDCMNEFSKQQRHLTDKNKEYDKIRVQTAPNYSSVRYRDDVKYIYNRHANTFDDFKVRSITPESPPIAGYTGYIAKVKGNEESLSQRYNTVVRRSMELLKEERERHSNCLINEYNKNKEGADC